MDANTFEIGLKFCYKLDIQSQIELTMLNFFLKNIMYLILSTLEFKSF